VVMIQSIFHLSLYAEIEIVVILANIVAIFLLRMVGKSLMD